jgi:predicted Zn finger-like uncharacterized protein
MILSCPSCKTRYNVDPAALRGGQSVRCVRCGNTWHQDPPDDLPIVIDPEPIPEPDFDPGSDADPAPDQDMDDDFEEEAADKSVEVPDVVQRRPAPEPTRKVNPLGWIIFAGVVVAFLATAVFFRNGIVAAWPPAVPLYETLGLSVETPSFGLELRKLNSSQTFDGDIPMLLVTGQVVNVSEEARVVPRVRIGLTNEAGREIYHWTFVVPDRELQPGSSTGFSTTLASPPEAAKHLAVTFVDE